MLIEQHELLLSLCTFPMQRPESELLIHAKYASALPSQFEL
jgi:hypothetical protein